MTFDTRWVNNLIIQIAFVMEVNLLSLFEIKLVWSAVFRQTLLQGNLYSDLK